MDELGQPARFADRLHAILEVRPECTQAWLAEKTGLERSTISRLVKGDRSPTLETAQAIAVALDVPVVELLKGTEAEAKLAEVSNVIPRGTYDSVVKTLLDYEGRISDLQGQLRHIAEALKREQEQTRTLRESLLAAELERDDLQREAETAKTRLKEAEAELRRHQEALKKAVADVASLTARIQQIASDSASANATSKVAAALAGIAAAAGVVTLAHYLSNDAPATRAPPRRTRPPSRPRGTPES